MKTVDVWETIAAIAMHVERARAAGDIPQSEIGAFSVATIVAGMNRAARTLHRIETERANGVRTAARKALLTKQEKQAEDTLDTHAKRLHIIATVENMGYVTLTAGAFRLGYLPMGAK